MTEDTHRGVSIERVANSSYVATSARGAKLAFGADDDLFSPVELLLAAIGGCTAIDVDALTSRRADPDSFAIEVGAQRVRDAEGSHLTDITVTFRVRFPDGEGGDKARELLPDAIRRSHDKLCTVSRTVELGATVTPRIE